jgi:hypothetical protein
MNLQKAIRDGWLAAALAFLLVIDLSTLPWFSYVATLHVGTASVSLGGSLSATDAPDPWLGVLAVIAAVLVIGDVAVSRLSPETPLPAIESRELTRLVLACVAGGFMAIKFLLHLGSVGNLGVGFWFGAALAAALVVVTRDAQHIAAASPKRGTTPAAS